LLVRFAAASMKDPHLAARVVIACSLMPDAVQDFARVEALAERAISGTEKDIHYPDFALARGLSEYRTGRHAGALEWLQRSVNARGSSGDLVSQAGLVLAYAQLGDSAARESASKTATEILSRPQNGRSPSAWLARLHARLLLRESANMQTK
jgi:hypothetical protein